MTIQEAIKARHSVRAYIDRPLEDDVVAALEEKISEVNAAGGLHVQLIRNEPKAFLGPMARYGKFRGVSNYLVMAGRKSVAENDLGTTPTLQHVEDNLDERVGYYGEQLVLFAQMLGLNTCWVGLSYSKIPGTYTLADGERIACYIALGYGQTQGVSHRIKTPEDVSNVGPDTPQWFLEGVKAALLAPTAINQQKFRFEYVKAGGEGEIRDNVRDKVIARKGFSLAGYTQMDLGIARLHFEIGAGKENFEWA